MQYKRVFVLLNDATSKLVFLFLSRRAKKNARAIESSLCSHPFQIKYISFTVFFDYLME